MKRVWARIGMSFDVPEEKYKKLVELAVQADEEGIGKLLLSCHHYPDGESYLPEDVNDNPSDPNFDVLSFPYAPVSERDPYKADILKKHLEKMRNDEYYMAQVTGSAGKNINLTEAALALLINHFE